MKRPDVFSTHTAAKLCRVTPMTIIRWIDEDRIKAFRTPGGHRRILRKDLEEFCRKAGIPVDEGFLEVRNRILIVDDEPIIVELLCDTIRAIDESFEVASVDNGFDAGRLVATFRPQLIFLDLRMPGVDGFQVCKAIKDDPSTAGTEVVIVTGHYTEENVERIRRYGASHVLRKPIDLETLRAIVREAFGMGEAASARRRAGKRSKRRKILLVSADTDSVRVVVGGPEALRATFDVAEAEGGMDALLAVGKESPDVVLLDTQISDIDPAEICRRVRASDEAGRITIIAVLDSSDDAARVAAEFREAGANLTQERPLSVETIRELLAR